MKTEMEEPISAFAVYQANAPLIAAKKLKNKKKRDKKRQKPNSGSSQDSISSMSSHNSIISSKGKKRKGKKLPSIKVNSLTISEIVEKDNKTFTIKKENKSITEDETSFNENKSLNSDLNGIPNITFTNSDESTVLQNEKQRKHKRRIIPKNYSPIGEIVCNPIPKKKIKIDCLNTSVAESQDSNTQSIVDRLIKSHKKLLNIEDDEDVPQLIPIKRKKKKINAEIISESNTEDVSIMTNDEEELSSQYSKALNWILSPLDVRDFFANTWENEPMHIKRSSRTYYSHLLTTSGVDNMLRKNSLHFGRNIDVVTYTDGKRETHNLEGRAWPAVVWDFYSNRCSIRILNPQTYCKKLHKVIASLQEDFGCMVGANLYLTPPHSQGFAPHYDDIEAFVIQLEGEKKWKLYNPINEAEVLPKYSSENFTEDKIGAPVMEITLRAGDLLYFPRGIIHQASTSDQHSLHITISTYQRTSWSDLLEKLLPAALKVAIAKNLNFRKGLPLNYLQHVGAVNSESTSRERMSIIRTIQKLMTDLVKYASIDTAADELGKQFMHDALPPKYTESELYRSVKKDGEHLKNGVVVNRVEISLSTKVRLLRYYALRLVVESSNSARIYHCVDNSLEYHGLENQYLDIDIIFAPAIEKLQCNYPNYIDVEDLPLVNDSDKIQLVGDLWERGLLVTQQPLDVLSD